jgi:hypothetical protein
MPGRLKKAVAVAFLTFGKNGIIYLSQFSVPSELIQDEQACLYQYDQFQSFNKAVSQH